MKFTVLGCSGGIGGHRARTTAFLINDDTLIDCGTGVGDLPFEALLHIDQVFLTHAHLDHVLYLPLLADAVIGRRERPIVVHAAAETLAALREHVFNGHIWPDFTRIPQPGAPVLSFAEMAEGACVQLAAGTVTALPAFHSVPALAWCLDSGAGRLVFSGDTRFEPSLLKALNALPSIEHLVVETAFPDEQQDIARDSSHLCPQELFQLLDGLSTSPQVHISHLKPGNGQRIIEQVGRYAGKLRPRMLCQGDVIEF